MFDDDAEEETLKSYELIRDSTYEEALSAYENQDYRNAYLYFTQYLHLASQLSKMLRTEGNLSVFWIPIWFHKGLYTILSYGYLIRLLFSSKTYEKILILIFLLYFKSANKNNASR